MPNPDYSGISAAEKVKLKRLEEEQHFVDWTRSVWGEQGEKASAALTAIFNAEGEDGLAEELAVMYHESGAARKRKLSAHFDDFDTLPEVKRSPAAKPAAKKAAKKPAAKAAAKPAAKAIAKPAAKRAGKAAAKAPPASKRASRRR